MPSFFLIAGTWRDFDHPAVNLHRMADSDEEYNKEDCPKGHLRGHHHLVPKFHKMHDQKEVTHARPSHDIDPNLLSQPHEEKGLAHDGVADAEVESGDSDDFEDS